MDRLAVIEWLGVVVFGSLFWLHLSSIRGVCVWWGIDMCVGLVGHVSGRWVLLGIFLRHKIG
jgi:hypothetical protein